MLMKKYSSTKVGNSRTYSRNRKVLFSLALTLFFAVLFFLIPRILASASAAILSPIVSIQNWFSESSAAVPSYLRDRQSLIEQNETLQQQLVETNIKEVEIEALRQENDLLKKLTDNNKVERKVASIIGRPTGLPYDVLIMDKGKDDGIKENTPVYLGVNQVIGFVASVYDHSSIVALVTTPGFSTTVYVYGPNIYTTATGVGSGGLRINVPQGIDLQEGNPVVIPSFNSGVYGEISYVDTVPTRPEQYGYVSIDVPLQSIRFVSIGDEPLHNVSFDEAKDIIGRVNRDFLSVSVPTGVLIDVPNSATTTDVATSTASTTNL